MVNTDVAKVIYTTVADAAHVYPVPFTPLNDMTTGYPALSVLLGGNALNYVSDYTYSADGVQLVAAPEAGQQLIIAQGQPFTQNIDLSFGLVDPEQIESGFDQSVIRDQQIRDAASAAQATADAAAAAADSASETANEAKTTADAASTTASEAKTVATEAKGAATDAHELARTANLKATSASSAANAATATAEAAQTKATAAENTANAALDAVAGKQDIIPDLETIRAGAAKGATAVQPAAIADMETKTHATATYQPKGDYATKTELSAGLATKADTATTDTLRNDIDGLGDQVHEIEAKVPADASASNQLATKADLANVDTLPAQAGNSGKFLTTDGATASWAEVAQGGGTWGSITGTLSDQTDLQAALDSKATTQQVEEKSTVYIVEW